MGRKDPLAIDFTLYFARMQAFLSDFPDLPQFFGKNQKMGTTAPS